MNLSWFSEIIDHVPEALLVVDQSGTIVWSNHRVSDLLGYQCKDLQGRSIEILIPERYRERHLMHRNNYIRSPSIRQMGVTGDLYACDKKGQEVPVDISLSHLHRDGKAWVFVAIRSDAIHREQRTRIKDQEEFLRRSQAIGHIGSWDWNIINNHLAWSDEVYHIFGVEPQSFDVTYDNVLKCIHPDDRNRVSSAVTAAVENNTPYRIEHRVIRPSGELRYVIEHGKAYRNTAGQSVRMLGTVQDVTLDREKQERLLLSQAVFDNCAEGIAIVDNHFKVIDANPVFNVLLENANQKKDQDIVHLLHHQSPNGVIEIGKGLKLLRRWKGEVWVSSISRDIIPTLVSIVAINECDSIPDRYVVTVLDITDLKKSENQLKYLAHYDQLTLLPNRTLYLQHLKKSLSQAEVNDDDLAIMYIDLDGFKQINDSQGHDVGDLLLKEVGTSLHRMISQYIFVARLGGDEFALIVEGQIANRSLDRIANILVRRLSFSKKFEDCILDISASVGISRYRHDSLDYLDLMRKADQAMYQAKHRGRNTYCYYDSAQGEKELYNIRLASEMRAGLDSNQYELHYQPKVCLKSNSVVGFEALIRWHHPDRGLISPLDFIPLAETTGLIIPIGHEILSKACSLLKRGGISPAKIAINLSAKQLHSRSLIRDIKKAIDLAKLTPNMLEIEITESVAMENVEANMSILRSIKEIGITIAIDDFGTGYSSLSYLKQLPVDILKIDRSFIFNLINSPEDKAIVTAIISLAKILGLKVIAEGVENIDQLNLLKAMDCDEAQGFFFSKPVTERELPVMMGSLSELMSGDFNDRLLLQ